MIRRRWPVSPWSSNINSSNTDNLGNGDYLHSSFRKLKYFNVALYN